MMQQVLAVAFANPPARRGMSPDMPGFGERTIASRLGDSSTKPGFRSFDANRTVFALNNSLYRMIRVAGAKPAAKTTP
jgi:hypothetical protein